MSRTLNRALKSLFAIQIGLTLIAGCSEYSPVATPVDFRTSGADASVATAGAPLLREVAAANAQYAAPSLAERAGFVRDPVCVSAPGLGGMGHHWVNGSRVDPAFQPLKPEVLLYARDLAGKLTLLGVEYIVINVGQPAPTFGGQPFDVGGTPVPVPHWSLHVWLYQANPSGTFAPFNPTVVCPGTTVTHHM